MTTDLFVRKVQRLLARRPASPGIKVQWSPDRGISATPVAVQPVAMKGGTGAPAPFISQPAEISPKPAKPFLEDIPTKFRFGMQQISIGGHSTSEMGGRGERTGNLVDGR